MESVGIDLICEFRKSVSPEIDKELSDSDVCRFLIARSFNMTKATSMAVKWSEWYDSELVGTVVPGLTAHNVLEITPFTNPDVHEEVYRNLMHHSNIGHTYSGTPVYWEKTGYISSIFNEVRSALGEGAADLLIIRHVRQQEFMFRERCKRASEYYNKIITKQVVVFNMKDVSYALDSVALQVFKRMLQIDEAFYPERLEVLYMINAPWFFSTIWNMIKGWLDPVTAKKMVILGTDYLPALREIMDDSQIPQEWGGSRIDFAWTYPDNKTESDEYLELAKGCGSTGVQSDDNTTVFDKN